MSSENPTSRPQEPLNHPGVQRARLVARTDDTGAVGHYERYELVAGTWREGTPIEAKEAQSAMDSYLAEAIAIELGSTAPAM